MRAHIQYTPNSPIEVVKGTQSMCANSLRLQLPWLAIQSRPSQGGTMH